MPPYPTTQRDCMQIWPTRLHYRRTIISPQLSGYRQNAPALQHSTSNIHAVCVFLPLSSLNIDMPCLVDDKHRRGTVWRAMLAEILSPVTQGLCEKSNVITGHFVYRLWHPEGRFVYRAGEGGGVSVGTAAVQQLSKSLRADFHRSVNCEKLRCCLIPSPSTYWRIPSLQ